MDKHVITSLPPKWMRLPAACAYSGMSRAKLYTLISKGKIKSICIRETGNIRGLRLISVESLDAYAESFIGK